MALNPIIDSRDVRFILFEMLKINELSKYPKFADFDEDTYEEVLTLAEKIAVGKVYPVNQESDKTHAQYIPATKEVIVPEGFKAGLDAYYEAGFIGIANDPEIGGMGMPESIYYACTDYFSAAGLAFSMYPMLSIGALLHAL